MKKTLNFISNLLNLNFKGVEYLLILFTLIFFLKRNIYDLNWIYHIYFIGFAYLILRLVFQIFKVSKKYFNHLNYSLFVIIIVESLLKILTQNPIIHDLIGKELHAQYSYEYQNIYHIAEPFSTHIIKKKEFTIERKYNSLGFADKEWEVLKNNKIRILCLGDSFTEGDGVASDSSYVSIFRNHLNQKYPNIEVMNAGNFGSDPFFNFKAYQNLLQKYQPDIIIQEYTYLDLYSDIITRGGNERFANDFSVQYRPAPKWEKLYAYSYVFRIFAHTLGGYNTQLLKKEKMLNYIKQDKIKTIELFKNYKKLTSSNQSDLIVFTFPIHDQFINHENNYFFQEMDIQFKKFGLEFYNLQPCYEDEIKRSHLKSQDYYWELDNHHNAKGYEMMAKCLEEIVTPIIKKRIENQNTLVN